MLRKKVKPYKELTMGGVRLGKTNIAPSITQQNSNGRNYSFCYIKDAEIRDIHIRHVPSTKSFL